MQDKKTILITGGAGFIGVNAAQKFIQQGWRVIVFDNLSRKGTEINLQYLKDNFAGNYEFVKSDVRNYSDEIKKAAGDAHVVLHLAGQVAVTTSVSNPRDDFEANALGTFNVLEAVREYGAQKPLLIYASTNKVYGDAAGLEIEEGNSRYGFRHNPRGVSECQQLDFHSPYGCSKGAADQYVRDYHRIYGTRTVVFRQSCIYGPNQFGIEDQGWVAWFVIASMLGRKISIYGDGKQVRDVLYIDDLIRLYQLAADNPAQASGKIYNIGGGPENTLSLLEFLDELEILLEKKIDFEFAPARPGDQKIYVSDISKIKSELGWEPLTSPTDGIDLLVGWVRANWKKIEPVFRS